MRAASNGEGGAPRPGHGERRGAAQAERGGAEDPLLAEVRRAYQGGGLAVFAGSGVPSAAGLPTPRALAALLGERARQRGASDAAVAEIAALAAEDRSDACLSAARHALGATELCAAIEGHLDDRGRDVPAVARAIAGLSPRLSAVITTNLDHLLERAFGGQWPALARATGDIAQRRGYILKLRGTLLDRSTWVLTREQREASLAEDEGLRRALGALFGGRTILFVGYHLADGELADAVGLARALAGDDAPRHFALVAEDAPSPYRRQWLEARGVQPIGYQDPDGRHAGAAWLLGILAGAGAAEAAEAGAEGAPRAAPRHDTPADRTARLQDLRTRITERFTCEGLEVFIAESFPEIRGGLAAIASPAHDLGYRAFKVIQHFEKRHRLQDLEAKLDKALEDDQ